MGNDGCSLSLLTRPFTTNSTTLLKSVATLLYNKFKLIILILFTSSGSSQLFTILCDSLGCSKLISSPPMAGTRGRMDLPVRNLSASGISVSSKQNSFFLIYSRFLFTLTATQSPVKLIYIVAGFHQPFYFQIPARSRSLGDIEPAKRVISPMFIDSRPDGSPNCQGSGEYRGRVRGPSIRTFLRSRTFAPSIVLRLPAHTRVMVSPRDISHHQLWK